MAIGDKIRKIRNLKGCTQKELGKAIGFNDKTADVRIAQYEAGTRTPKNDLINTLADVLNVSPQALDAPSIDDYTSLMHTLFSIEDLYGLKVGKIDGELCLRLDKSKGIAYLSLLDMFNEWENRLEKLENNEITKEEYDNWRYNYADHETTQNDLFEERNTKTNK